MNQELKIEAGDNQKMVISHLHLINILLVVIPIVLIIRLGIADGPGIGNMMGLGYMGLILSIFLSWFYLALAVILSFRIRRNSTFRIVLGVFLLPFAFGFFADFFL